jgi:hypothetical protein
LAVSGESSLHPIADALVSTHGELDSRTKTALAQATARAAEAAANAEKPIDVNSTSHLRDLAASAARIFGWDSVQAQETLSALIRTHNETLPGIAVCVSNEDRSSVGINR